jgi:hypothetical protein
MVARKAGLTSRAGTRSAKGIKRNLSRRTKPAMTQASKASTLVIKETVRLYEPALRRLADR